MLVAINLMISGSLDRFIGTDSPSDILMNDDIDIVSSHPDIQKEVLFLALGQIFLLDIDIGHMRAGA